MDKSGCGANFSFTNILSSLDIKDSIWDSGCSKNAFTFSISPSLSKMG